MNSADSFYQIQNVEQDESSCRAVVTFDSTHPIFKGHFPGRPVVPGVMTLTIVRQLLNKALGREIGFQSAPAIKFLRMLLPEDQVLVEVSWTDADNGCLRCSATAKVSGEDALKFSGLYGACA